MRSHVRNHRYVPQRERLVRNSLDSHDAFDDFQVVSGDLEHARGDAQHLVLDLAGREARGAHGDARGATATGADQTERRAGGIAVHHPHGVERYAQFICDHLGQGRLVALTVRRLGAVHSYVAVDLESHLRLLRHRGWHANRLR